MENLLNELEVFSKSEVWGKMKDFINKKIEASENVRDNPDTPERVALVELGRKLALKDILNIIGDLKRKVILEMKKEEQKNGQRESSGR